MNEYQIIQLALNADFILKLVSIISLETESFFKYMDLLLFLKTMDINIYAETPYPVEFAIMNVVDILDMLSMKHSNVYGDFFKQFKEIVVNWLNDGVEKSESVELIRSKITELEGNQTNSMNEHYQNGINILRIEILPS